MKRLFGPQKENNTSDNSLNGSVGISSSAMTQDGIRGLSCLYSPQKTQVKGVRDILDVLFDNGKITTEQVEQVRQIKTIRRSSDMEQYLLDNNFVEQQDVLIAKAELCGHQFRQIKSDDVDKQAFDKLAVDYIKQSLVMPIEIHDETLVIAMADPNNVFTIDDVK